MMNGIIYLSPPNIKQTFNLHHVDYDYYLLGVCFVAEDPVRRNTFGRSSQKAVPKLSSIKLRHSNMSQDEGVNRLEDEMTNRPVIACIMIVSICKGHECNFSQVAPYAYK
jgi:hypothetical protein